MQNFPSLHGLTHSLMGKATSYSTKVTKDEFISWGVEVVPFIFSCLPTFTHNLIFHGKSAKPHPDSSYIHPKLLDTSDILDEDPSLVFTICCMAPNLGGKVSLFRNRKSVFFFQSHFHHFSTIIIL